MTPDSAQQRWKHFAAVSVLLIVIACVFSRTFSYGLLNWDDQLHLTANPFIQPDSSNRYAYFWEHSYGKLYIPITYNAWGWLYARSFDSASIFSPHWLRAANITAHATASALVYFLLFHLLARNPSKPNFKHLYSGRNFPALIGALFFALHPLQVESVAWISEFRGLLASILALAAMLSYFADLQRSDSSRLAAFLSRFIAPPLLLAIAFLCKPSVAGVPAILFAIDVFWISQPLKKIVMALAAPALLTFVSLIVMRHLQAGDTSQVLPMYFRPLVAGDALSFYVGKLAWPFSLTADYSRTPVIARATTWFWFAWIMPAGIFGICILLWKRFGNRLAITAPALFIAGLLPVLGLVPFEFQHFSTVADRYAYLAMLGPALLVAWLSLRYPMASILCSVLLSLLAWRSIDQTRSWRDDDTLWSHAVAVNPNAIVATGNLAYAMAERSERQEAEKLFHRVIELQPDRASGYRGLGRLAVDNHQPVVALAWYERACAAEPTDAPSQDGAGSMLLELGQVDKAEARFRDSVAIDPAFADGWNNLGALLLQHGRPMEALNALDCALTANPRHPQALINLAYADAGIGDDVAVDRALRHAAEVLKQNALPARLLGQRALVRRSWPDAESWCRSAIAIDPTNVAALNDLGQALAAERKVDEAIQTFEHAIAIRPDIIVLQDNLASARKLKEISNRATTAPSPESTSRPHGPG